jgi:hypothetical protein
MEAAENPPRLSEIQSGMKNAQAPKGTVIIEQGVRVMSGVSTATAFAAVLILDCLQLRCRKRFGTVVEEKLYLTFFCL